MKKKKKVAFRRGGGGGVRIIVAWQIGGYGRRACIELDEEIASRFSFFFAPPTILFLSPSLFL